MRILMVLSSMLPTAVLAIAPADNPVDASAKLFKSIGDACHAATGGGQVAPADLRSALSTAYPIVQPWDGPEQSRELVIEGIRTSALNPGPGGTGPNDVSMFRIGYLVRGWVLGTPGSPGFDQGGLRIVATDGHALGDGDLGPVLRDIFLPPASGATRQYAFACKTPVDGTAPVPEKKGELPRPTITIAKAADQLGKLKAEDQKAGELSFTDDRLKRSLSFATTIALGLRIPLNPRTPVARDAGDVGGGGLRTLNANVIPFVSYDRQGSGDATEKSYVNNLSFGVATNGYLAIDTAANRRAFTAYYSLNGRYETDDGLHSSAWFMEAALQPITGLPGNSQPYPIVGDDVLNLAFQWTATGVLDHSSVTDPWKKQALIDTRHFTRLGGDIGAALILAKWKGPYDNTGYGWSVSLNGNYAQRWNLGSSKGTAHLFTGRLTFSPAKNYSFSIGYDDGFELDSLAQKRQWKVTIDLKR